MEFGKDFLSAIAAIYFSLTGVGGPTANNVRAAEPMNPSEVRKALGSRTCQIEDLNGYKMCEGTDTKLKLVAGVKDGSVKPRIEERKGRRQLFWMGDADSVNPSALDDVLRSADANDDGIITRLEAHRHSRDVYRNTNISGTDMSILDAINTTDVAGSISLADVNGDGILAAGEPGRGHGRSVSGRRGSSAAGQDVRSDVDPDVNYLNQGEFNRLVTTNPEAKGVMDKVYSTIDSLNRQWHRDGVRMGLKTDVAFKDGKIDLDNSFAYLYYLDNADTDRITKSLEDIEVSCGQDKDGRIRYCDAGNIPRIDRGRDWRHFTWGDVFAGLETATDDALGNSEKARIVALAPDNGGDDLRPENIRFTYIHTGKDGKPFESEDPLSDTPGYVYYFCSGGRCEGANGGWPGNLTRQHKVIRNGEDVMRYVVLNRQGDGGYIARIPFSALDGEDSAAPGIDDALSERDRDSDPIPATDHKKLPGKDTGDKEKDSGRKLVIEKKDGKDKDADNDKGAADQAKDAYLGARALVYASDLIHNDVAGGAEFYFGHRISDTDWSFELSFGYLSGGPESSTRDLTTGPNPNDPRERDVIFTGTERKSSDYHILVPRVGFAYDASDDLRLGLRLGADIVVKNTDTTIDERLEYPNGDLAGTPKHESRSSTDVTGLPGASLTLDYRINDNVSLSGEVSGATDGDNYNIGGGVGVTFQWDW